MITFTLKLDIEPGLDRLANDPDGILGVAVRRFAENVADEARATAPVATGRYRDSITVGPVTRSPIGLTCIISADIGYGIFVERRHEVLARALQRTAVL